jgi:GH25 family lysozyme M1 (1,4-beta-N-acetylmuramidase)
MENAFWLGCAIFTGENLMAVPLTFAQGIDISKWNISYDPTKKRVDFCLIKASDGIARDPAFNKLLNEASTVPIRGAYHYYRSGVAWQVQADNFLAAVKGLPVNVLAIDYEHINNTLSKATDDVLKLILAYVAAESGKKVLLYTQYNMITAEMPSRGSSWVKTYDALWVARWYERGYYYNTATSPGITNWKVWQYGGDYHTSTWSVPGYKQGYEYGVENDSIDLDTYSGTPAEMRVWLGMLSTETPPPLEQPPLTLEDRVARLEEYVMEHGGF